MRKLRALAVPIVATLATVAMLGTGCALSHGSAGGTYIDAADAAATVVLHVSNVSTMPMELRTVQNGRSDFIGSVGAADTTSILLDPMLFPTASLYVVGIPANSQGQASAGPLAASKGARILFTIEPNYAHSYAIVVR
ncbi:MAG: hypothetical protein ABI205_08785 [Gemmatimonadaceae bacterium]